MKKIMLLYHICRKSDSNFLVVLVRAVIIKLRHKKLFLLHQNVTIKGIKNIQTKNRLNIGMKYVGFMDKKERTYLNIQGALILNDNYDIGRGCRINIDHGAVMEVGRGGFLNVNTTIVITKKLKIGDNCVISWNCQFLDNDFHEINYSGKREVNNGIEIGNNVWIGCGASIYKGTVIADGCVVASNAVVRGIFNTPNVIIAGNPAKVIKENISWN